MKLKIDARGRTLKCEQWPELAKTLEYIFNVQDVKTRRRRFRSAFATEK